MLSVLAGLGLGLSLIIAIGAQNVFVLRQGIRREHVFAVVAICAASDALLIVAGVAGLGFIISAAPWLVVVARWAGAVFLLGYGLLAARRSFRGDESLSPDDPPPPARVVRSGGFSGPDAAESDHTTARGAKTDHTTKHRATDGFEASDPADGRVVSSGGFSGPDAAETDHATAARAETDYASRKGAAVEDGRARRGEDAARVGPVILTVLALTWLNPHVYLDTVLMLGSIAATYGDERWLFAAGAVAASILWFTALGFGARYVGRWLRTSRSWRILDAAIAAVMIALAVSLVLPVFSS